MLHHLIIISQPIRYIINVALQTNSIVWPSLWVLALKLALFVGSAKFVGFGPVCGTDPIESLTYIYLFFKNDKL